MKQVWKLQVKKTLSLLFPRYTVAGRSMYTKPGQKHSLGDATELWSGLYTSVSHIRYKLWIDVLDKKLDKKGVCDLLIEALALVQGSSSIMRQATALLNLITTRSR